MDDSLLTIVLVAAGICALIGAFTAAENGRPTAGAALGLLFGPLGIIMALLLRPTPAVQAAYNVLVAEAEVEVRELRSQNTSSGATNPLPR